MAPPQMRVLVTCALLLGTCAPAPTLAAGPNSGQKLTISSAGINVPKRPTIIAGLNQQFKAHASNSSGPLAILASPAVAVPKPVSSLLSAVRFGPRPRPLAATTVSAGSHASPATSLYLDREQQQLLAANPSLQTTGATTLLTRSDVGGNKPAGAAPHEHLVPAAGGDRSSAGLVQGLSTSANHPAAAAAANQPNESTSNSSVQARGEPNAAAQFQPQRQHSYRGYSLIELEVKSEHDRRFVRELYGNLSDALSEQAQRPHSISVSPYADIDFWSLGDQIDIMVSPKSRAFILAQLGRARIKHRTKIDDIQTRLDGQGHSGANSTGAGLAKSMGSAGELSGRQQPAEALSPSGAATNDSLFFENYHRLADINQYLESVVARARDIAKVQVIGRSSQGRYLRVLRLGHEQLASDGSTHPSAGADTDRPGPPSGLNASAILEQFLGRQRNVKKLGALWLDGGTHAREWISPATVLYIAFRLSDNHARCLRFFDYLTMVVNQSAGSSSNNLGLSERAAVVDETELLNGINEINSSLSSSSDANAGRQRARTELEQKLELLAKRPQEVASEHACDLELEQLLRKYTFYIMPVLNPDGYEYSHTHNRLWRKTRSTSAHPIYRHFCLGADPNRNYDARHGSTGSSSHPCSQTYSGATPFTEPETRHQSNFVYAHRQALKMFISFHSYSQMILLPFSHSKQLAPDHKDLESVGQAAVRAIERTHGTQYRVGSSASILYTAAGTASDWAYEKAGIKYSYTIELRDTGTYGFLLPRQQIVPTGEETFNGLLAMISQMELNDRHLTSKSASTQASSGASSTGEPADAGLVHAPDLDQLRPFGRFRPRPAQLENALDGSETWATPEPRPPGVRARAPHGDAPAEELDSANRILEDEVLSVADAEEPDAGLAFEGEGELMEPTNNLSVGSALNGQFSDAASQSAAKLLGHIHAHSSASSQMGVARDLLGRQALVGSGELSSQSARQKVKASAHQLGLSANGRSLINSPPGPARATGQVQRRESSNEFAASPLSD